MKLNGIKRRRTIISSFFITVLFGIAFKESANPIWEIIQNQGFSASTAWILPFIFIVTAIRFFIGNQLHLLEIEKETAISSFNWLMDFVFIVVESFIFIFIAKTCSIKISLSSKAGFFGFIVILLLVDIFWILLQMLSGIIRKQLKRKFYPWKWMILNIFTFLVLYILYRHNILYKNTGLILSGVIFTIAAIIDVIMIDCYVLLKDKIQPHTKSME